jgi:hypothetical protein
LLAKDLVVGSKTYPKVKGFADTMAGVSAITNYFSHSNFGRYWLDKEMEKEEPENRRGIQAAGGTRFSTFSLNGRSVIRCWPAMQRCHTGKRLKFEGQGAQKVKRYLTDVTVALTFLNDLNVVIAILSPIEYRLKTLEGLNATLSDVFFIFIGIGVAFVDVFSDVNGPLSAHKSESYAAYNRRFAFLLNEASEDLFFLAYLLDPGTSFYLSASSHYVNSLG